MCSPSYAKALREKMEHVPVARTLAADAKEKEAESKDKVLEAELIPVLTSMGRHAKIHRTERECGRGIVFRRSGGDCLAL